jgi:Ca-activated chloride channel family protein
MFRFEHPEFFWLMIIPVLGILFYYVSNRLSRLSWGAWGSETSNTKAIEQMGSYPRHWWMGLAGIILLCLAAVNPQWGYKKTAVQNKSADLYLALDISNSMLAEDVAPNRLDRAKKMAMDISNEFKTDRVGLILFAGNAYIQSPLTTDWHAIQLYLNAANPDQAGTQGTAIGEAVRLALKSKKDNENPEDGAIIMLTDGEDHDSDAKTAIEEAVKAGWTTYIIGVGTEAGGHIPIMVDGNKDLKRDENGQPVTTRLNEPLMKELADAGHGLYFNLTDNTTILDDLKKELSTLERTQMQKRSFSEHKSYFQWFLISGLLLILGAAGLNFRFDVI